jgi:hypothetical protein
MEELEIISDDEKIGDGLVRMGIMSKIQVEDILKKQEKGDDRLFGIIALELGYIDDTAIKKYFDSKKK